MHATTTIDSRRTRARSRAGGVRRLSVMALIWVTAAGISGCGLRDFELDIELPNPLFTIPIVSPGLASLPPRLALGSTAQVQVISDGESSVSSSDSSVVIVDPINAQAVRLTAVGVGSAAIRFSGAGEYEEYDIRVDTVDRSEVIFAEPGGFLDGPIEVVEADEQSFVSGVAQHLVVAHYDADGELLYGEGLATHEIREGAEPCEVELESPLDEICVVLQPGPNVVRVQSAVEERDIAMHGVEGDQIVDLIVLQTEGVPSSGASVGMVSFGLTEDDTWVFGVGAEYTSPYFSDPFESFAYKYDPEAAERTVKVSASGFEREVVFQGDTNPFVSHPNALWAPCGEGLLVEPCQ